jgi:osmotically-inducible protein OsmY
MKQPLLYPLILLPLLLGLLQGCAGPAVVAGAAGGAAAAQDQRSAPSMFDDTFIEARAKDALYADADTARRIHINVTSYNGVVLLTGEALSEELRQQAVDIVRHLDKVRRVHNEIRVADLTGFKSRANDTWLTSKVKGQMIGTKGFDSTRVKVITEAGTVYLMGLVSRDQGHQAAEIASLVDGVKRVVKVFEYQ